LKWITDPFRYALHRQMRILQGSLVTSAEKTKWKWCAAASAAIMLLALIPQIHLWFVRGRDWNGAYATLQGDEFLYSAYINALIDGRPRRNDPFAGQDNRPVSPLPESSFSIQFMPAYWIAVPARVFGVSASTAFISYRSCRPSSCSSCKNLTAITPYCFS